MSKEFKETGETTGENTKNVDDNEQRNDKSVNKSLYFRKGFIDALLLKIK